MVDLFWRVYRHGSRNPKTEWVLLRKHSDHFERLARVEYHSWRRKFGAHMCQPIDGKCPGGEFGSALSARKWIEAQIDKASIGIFNDDEVTFKTAA